MPGVSNEPELHLRGAEVRQVAIALEITLRTHRCNGRVPDGELRDLAVKVGAAVPLVAVCLPGVLDAMGAEAADIVKSQAADAAGKAKVARPGPLGCSEASRQAGVSARAVRAAAQVGRLAARKHKVTGAWVIETADLRKWMRNRAA
jgi:hypothetical protein